jgi:hypothetical protein
MPVLSTDDGFLKSLSEYHIDGSCVVSGIHEALFISAFIDSLAAF